MKFETKKRKQIESVKQWLAKARHQLQEETLAEHKWPAGFALLIAVEQLVKYLEMKPTESEGEEDSSGK